MKHASAATLRAIEGLLAELRALPGLTEKGAGKFYRKGSALLHFHEDPAGLFADLKVDGEWIRHAVNSATARARLVRAARRLLA
jgi:hypothetical protein